MSPTEVRNTGWPVPYGDTWPLSSRQPLSAWKIEPIHMFGYRDEVWVQPYGWNQFGPATGLGRVIDEWR